MDQQEKTEFIFECLVTETSTYRAYVNATTEEEAKLLLNEDPWDYIDTSSQDIKYTDDINIL